MDGDTVTVRVYNRLLIRQANSTPGAGHAHTPDRPDYPGSLGSEVDLDLVGYSYFIEFPFVPYLLVPVFVCSTVL